MLLHKYTQMLDARCSLCISLFITQAWNFLFPFMAMCGDRRYLFLAKRLLGNEWSTASGQTPKLLEALLCDSASAPQVCVAVFVAATFVALFFFAVASAVLLLPRRFSFCFFAAALFVFCRGVVLFAFFCRGICLSFFCHGISSIVFAAALVVLFLLPWRW